MNRNRGSMGGCNHTNDDFYGSNGCRQCDAELEEWNRRQAAERKELEMEELRRRVAKLEKKKPS